MNNLPERSICLKFSEAEIIDYLTTVITILDNNQENVDVINDMLIRICNSYFDWENHINKICQLFIEKHLLDTVYIYLDYFHRKLNIKDKLVNYLYTLLTNFSDASVEFAQNLNSSKVLPFIIDQCTKKEFINDIHDENIKEHLENCVLVVSNVARDLGNQIEYKEKELKESLIEFIKLGNEDKLAIQSMLTLSYIINDSEVNLLVEGSNTVNGILMLIKETCSIEGREGNYSIPELMLGLFRISANNEIKEKINQNGGIPIIIDILHAKVENEIELTLGTIYNLCFNQEIKQKLIDEFEIENSIKLYENHVNPEIKKYHDGIMWEIKGKNEIKEKESDSKKSEFDVFVSYAHQNKSKVMEIFNELKKWNIRIWIDKEQMTGSILEAMARGIENSRFFIIGISPYYEKSPNCRSEAEYAYQRQKTIIPMILACRFKPEGWLGFIRGMKMYYEISERRNVEEVIEDLVHTLKTGMGDNGEQCKSEHFKEPGPHTDDNAVANKSINEKIKNWSTAETASWLDDSKLGHLKKRLNDLDGKLLYVMLDIRSKSPDYFNKTLKKEFGMKFMEVLKFHNALNNLAYI